MRGSALFALALAWTLGLSRSAQLPLPTLHPLPEQLLLNPCMDALLEASKDRGVLEQLILAAGKDLPFDAGKYMVCENIKVAFDVPTKFFIVSFRLGDPAAPGEVGLCLPASCRDEDISILRDLLALGNGTLAAIARDVRFPQVYSGDGYPPPAMTVNYPNPFSNQDDFVPWGQGTSLALAVCAVLSSCVIYCTWSERRLRSAALPSSWRLRVVRAFAFLGPEGTWRALCKVDASRPTDCLNGIRVLSMLFIIIGHGVTQPLEVSGYSNAECVRKTPYCLNAWSTSPFIEILLAGEAGVDTFFFLGGFLLSYVGMSRSTPVVMGMALRYARLLPCLGFVMMIYVLIAPYVAFGPFGPRFQNDVFSNCSNSSWWSELLFISSVYPWMSSKACMGWSWYLGLDMLFAFVGLVLLNVRKSLPVVAWALAMLLAGASLVVTVQQSLHYGLQFSFFGPHEGDFMHYLYSKFYSRTPVFLLGLVSPWAMEGLRRKHGLERGTQPHSCRAVAAVMLACVLAVAVGACCIFLPSLNNAGPGPMATARRQDNWTPWESALWIAFTRPVWGLCNLVIVLACYYGYLPLVDAVLAHRVWAPLTKLTYGAYLLHPVIIKVLAGNALEYYSFSYAQALIRCFGYFCLAYCASALLWCLVERPVAALTSLLVAKNRTPACEPAPLLREREQCAGTLNSTTNDALAECGTAAGQRLDRR